MKEAAGEANMTVITIVLIAVVLGVGSLIVTNLMENVKERTETMESGNCPAGYTQTTEGGCIKSSQ